MKKQGFKFTLFNTLIFLNISSFMFGVSTVGLFFSPTFVNGIYCASFMLLSIFMVYVMMKIFFTLHLKLYKKI